MKQLSVVIPAFDEAAMIARCLESVVGQRGLDRLEVVVVANGCRDATAELAREFGDPVRVVELAEGSKHRALNAGDAECTLFPRVYLDADVRISPDCLLRCHEALAGGLLAVAPTPRFHTADSGFLVRSFYRGWSRTPYFTGGRMIVSGFYALSEAGRGRFEAFPPVISDDGFVHGLFDLDERRTLPDCSFEINAPRTLGGLVAIATRSRLGALELRERGFTPREPAGGGTTAAGQLANLLRAPVPTLAYSLIRWLTRRRAARQFRAGRLDHWERDESTRAG
ncbi:MAG: glycosyltransferase family 2 protein [Planctomycetota bacterium]|nr:glycosyltransferase family 2 protein [Planctomycetota bacterium]